MPVEFGKLLRQRAFRPFRQILFASDVGVAILPKGNESAAGLLVASRHGLQKGRTARRGVGIVRKFAHGQHGRAEAELTGGVRFYDEIAAERDFGQVAGESAMVTRKPHQPFVAVAGGKSARHGKTEQTREDYGRIERDHDLVRFGGRSVAELHAAGAFAVVQDANDFLSRQKFAAQAAEAGDHPLRHGDRPARGNVGVISAEVCRDKDECQRRKPIRNEIGQKRAEQRMPEAVGEVARVHAMVAEKQGSVAQSGNGIPSFVVTFSADTAKRLCRSDSADERADLPSVGGGDGEHRSFQTVEIAPKRKAFAVPLAGEKAFAPINVDALTERAEIFPHPVERRVRVGAREPMDAVVDAVIAAPPAGEVPARHGEFFADYRAVSRRLCVNTCGEPRHPAADDENIRHNQMPPKVRIILILDVRRRVYSG